MTIALFSDCFSPTKNGVVTVILQLRERLQKLGHTVIVVTVQPDIPVQKEPNVYRVIAAPIGMGTDQYLAFPNVVRLVHFLKDKHIDIIHVHSEFTMGAAGYRVARILHVPAILTTHTLWEEFYPYYLPLGKIIPADIIRRWLRHFCRKFYALINVSQKAYNYFHEDFMVPEKPAAIIPNSIEPDKFCKTHALPEEIAALRTKHSIKDDDIVLLFVGRIGEEKRVFELLSVCQNVINRNNKIKMIFVGAGPALMPLQKLATDYTRKGSIIFTGFVNWYEVHTYYELADIFVTASLSEMHSMTILEALHSGLPVIARNDLSLADTVHSGENGVLVETEEDMEEEILSLAQDARRRTQYRGESLKIAQNFSPELFGLRHEQFYKEVLKAFPKPMNEQVLKTALAAVSCEDAARKPQQNDSAEKNT